LHAELPEREKERTQERTKERVNEQVRERLVPCGGGGGGRAFDLDDRRELINSAK